MWPFKKKETPVEAEPEHFTLRPSDDGMTRARAAMRCAGFVINENLYNQLPWIAQVLDAYKELDYEAGVRDAKSKQ